MAVDVCSEISSPVVSPRISFSHDLRELDFVPVESRNARSDALLLNPTIDFCIGQNLSLEISSADELFADGKILPLQIKKPDPPRHETRQPHPVSARPKSSSPHKTVQLANDSAKKKRLIEYLSTSFDADEQEEKPLTKPFWQFRRSSSVSGDNSMSNGLLRFLTRSNSTGSVPNPKPPAFPKVMQKQHSLKEASVNRPNPSVPSVSQYCPYNSNASKKSSLRNTHRISPVLNIPPTYTVSLFGIGSFFCRKKSKKKR